MNLMWWLGLIILPFIYFFALYLFLGLIAWLGSYILHFYKELGDQWVKDFKEKTPIWQRWLVYWVLGLIIYGINAIFWYTISFNQ